MHCIYCDKHLTYYFDKYACFCGTASSIKGTRYFLWYFISHGSFYEIELNIPGMTITIFPPSNRCIVVNNRGHKIELNYIPWLFPGNMQEWIDRLFNMKAFF